MKFYAADNKYGSDTDVGFANTWMVFAFDSKKSRDSFVKNGDRSTRAILRDEIGKYLIPRMSREVFRPYSGDHYRIVYAPTMESFPGMLGQVIIAAYGHDERDGERLNK